MYMYYMYTFYNQLKTSFWPCWSREHLWVVSLKRCYINPWMNEWMNEYLIMYRKYVRKWWLLKRHRIICPEVHVAVNEQFLNGKSKFFVKFHEKIKFLLKFAWKNRIRFKITMEKSKFFENLPGKIDFFYPDLRPPDFKPDWRRCVCVHVRARVGVWVCVLICLGMCDCVYVCMCMYVCEYVCVYVCVCMYVYVCMFVYVCVHVGLCIHAYVGLCGCLFLFDTLDR